MIKGQLEPLYQTEFPSSYRSLNVVAFSGGSVITTMDLDFISTLAPNNTQIASVLINANVTGFDIEGSSITVDGISSSGVSHKISLFTASCLVLLSWLLSSQQ
ncbi:cell wall protein DAN4-like isoform X1 [Lates japonicus]|uniref:Cell wall protein DAN4-like isoform X1 n=1 Tax=Lates japonicus TaxID=270547 RepID=A0AAD3MH56_LATJO|nr:cell wall protein DAN4-like isoform X1 [Lates japonicus]